MSEAAASASQPALPEQSPGWRRPAGDDPRPFADLRSVQWRVNLGILPSSPSSSIDDLRRVTADTRRRYASLRRRLLVDPHILKDERYSPNLLMDNPLSQNPDSIWSQFFRNAELEKMVDQDLMRLYPEHGSYFQTSGCQGILRRILLLWCLRHPEYGYRQGMHELLAPLLYVLQVDVEHLSQVRKLYEDHFTDKFDELSSYENDLYHFEVRRSTDTDATDVGAQGSVMKMRSLDEIDPDIKRIILLNDAYGAEGELGIVLSEKFMEHDAYSMFDALMSGGNGSVAMVDFYSYSPIDGSRFGRPPVIEASASLYNLLSLVDSSLHSHLIELGVEPQYFALRWLRVLFGREFVLTDLLVIWDEIFMFGNNRMDESGKDDEGSTFRLLGSPRGALIAGFAVSMILYLRSSLLSTEHATSCLQRLLSFPENVNLKKLIQKAKSVQELALDSSILSSALPQSGTFDRRKSIAVRTHSPSSDLVSPSTPLNLIPDSYWEEKWRVLHQTEELKQGSSEKEVATKKKGWSQRLRLSLPRTESNPSPAKMEKFNQEINTSVQRNLLDDLSQLHKSDEVVKETNSQRNSIKKDYSQNFVEVDSEREAATKTKEWSQRLRLSLPRTESDPSPVNMEKTNQEINTSIQQNLSDNLYQPHKSSEVVEEINCQRNSMEKDHSQNFVGVDGERENNHKDFISVPEEGYLSRNVGSEESSPLFSGSASPLSMAADHENNTDRSSVASNRSTDEQDHFPQSTGENLSPVINGDATAKSSPNSDSNEKTDVPPMVNGDAPAKCDPTADSTGKTVTGLKERKPLSGKFQWLRKFGRNSPTEATCEKRGNSSDVSKTESIKDNSTSSFVGNGSSSPSVTSKGDGGNDQNATGNLKNLGQSMLEHIQIIESVFQLDQVQTGTLDNLSKNPLVGKGQVTAMGALKELRKISNLLSEM